MSRDDDREERPRRSWSEIDKRRGRAREPRDERRPQGAAAQARARQATDSYLRQVDQRLFGKRGAAPSAADGLAAAVRAAHGTPGLDAACRQYLEEAGPPAADPALLGAFLDAEDRAVRLAALDVLASLGTPPAGGLRSQLRMLAEGSDDEIAERAETLLAPR